MDQCIFCKIAAGEIPSSTVYEDEYFKAILDLSPATKGHTIIIPKKHMKDAAELEGEYAKRILPVAAKIGMAMKKGLGCTGFNLVQNNGESAGQTVMHYHMHVIPRYDGGEKIVTWPQTESTADERDETARKIKNGMEQ